MRTSRISSRRTIIQGIAGVGLTTTARRYLYPAAERVQSIESTEALWNRIIPPFLADDQWNETFAYDAAHLLMVPIHFAFADVEAEGRLQEFMDHAVRMTESVARTGLPENRTTKLQYLYLWSQFAVLAAKSSMLDRVPPNLVQLISDEHQRHWSDLPAWQWDRDDFPGGVRERLQWKRDNLDVSPGYYRAIIDEELFLFGIAADLVVIGEHGGGEASDAAYESVRIADIIFAEEGSPQANGGWLFQPGVWSEHRDYAYAGHIEVTPDMEEWLVPGISMDTSHSHRFPLWLRSLASISGSGARDTFYSDILTRLDRQFFNSVLVPPTEDFPGYRTTNYLDGHNGLYRWEYETQGKNNGYAAYEVSGTLCLGWWSFLGTDRAHSLYREMAKTFPLAETVIDTYEGPNTTRERHPLAMWPDFFTNGFAELLIRLAAEVAALEQGS